MLVEFRIVNGQSFRLNLIENVTVRQIKQYLVDKNYLQPGFVKIIFHSRFLSDNVKLSSLNLKGYDFLICHSKKVKEKEEKPPENENHSENQQQNGQENQNQSEEQPDIVTDDAREALMALGFSTREAYIALRLARNNVELAADLLYYNRNPHMERNPEQPRTLDMPPQNRALRNISFQEEPVNPSVRINPVSIEITDQTILDESPNITMDLQSLPIVEEIKAHPEKFSDFIKIVDSTDHDFATSIRSNPESFLIKIGCNPNDYDCEEIRFISPEFRYLPVKIRRSMRNILRMKRTGLISIVEMLAECNQKFDGPIRKNPEGFIKGLGLDPRDYDCNSIRSELQPTLDEVSNFLTPEELQEVEYLSNLGIGINFILNQLDQYDRDVDVLHNELTTL